MANEFNTTSDTPYGSLRSFLLDDMGSQAESETDLLPDDESENDYGIKTSLRTYEYDVAVIGGGQAGYTAAIHAARRGAKTILFERETLGGSGLTAGYVPINVYLNAAAKLRTIRTASEYGITVGDDAAINLKKTLEFKDSVISKITSNAARQLRAHRIRVEAGEASIKNAHEINCRGRVYSASKIILCGGSRMLYPEIPGLSHRGVLTPEGIFKLSGIPSRLMVLGGGIDGCEIAAAFATFGSNVMLIENEDRVLPEMDASISAAMQNTLVKVGVKVYTGIYVKEIIDRNGDPFVITQRGGVLCDNVMVTTWRKPDLSCHGELAKKISPEGEVVPVNEYMETLFPGIYAAGAITGSEGGSYAAYRMAEIAAENAIGGKRAINLRVLPRVIYTEPAVASVGLTEAEARDKYGDDLLVGCVSFEDNIRAILAGQTEGFVKVLAGKKYGEIYGVHIVSSEAAEMIGESAALMKMEVTIHEIANDIPHAHPTLAEVFPEACAAALHSAVGSGGIR